MTIRPAARAFLAVLAVAACAWPSPAGVVAVGPAQAARGREVRAVLLERWNPPVAHDGSWPERLDAPGLTYTRPQLPTDGPLVRAMPAATVVVRESFDAHPDGVWVGYADGHLEFAPTAEALRDCLDQVTVLRESHAPPVATTGPPPPTDAPAGGDARLKLVDADGKPVAGALVGVFVTTGNAPFVSDAPSVRFARPGDDGKPLVSDDAGGVVLPAEKAFAAKFRDRPTAPLYILHKDARPRGAAGRRPRRLSPRGGRCGKSRSFPGAA